MTSLRHLSLSERIRLQGLKARFTERSDEDRPDFVVVPVGTDGGVEVRPLSFEDVVAWCESRVRGEVIG